jgi:gas vesicle protein
MGQDPSDIRAEIEETRSRVGDEVDALSYKTDVGARVGDYVDEKKEAVKSAVTGTASKALPSGRQLARVKDTAERNPLGLVVGGAAVGFVAGLLIPSTRVENEQMGELSDRLVDAARDTVGEAAERGKQVAQEATQSAVETAKERGSEESRELASDLQERTQETTGASASTSPGS